MGIPRHVPALIADGEISSGTTLAALLCAITQDSMVTANHAEPGAITWRS